MAKVDEAEAVGDVLTGDSRAVAVKASSGGVAGSSCLAGSSCVAATASTSMGRFTEAAQSSETGLELSSIATLRDSLREAKCLKLTLETTKTKPAGTTLPS